MPEPETSALERTPLHDWHIGHGARMVPFGGWSMPLNYGPGVVREHIGTRTQTGLFDVSHMGRFRIVGRGAQDWLARILTNDASTLAPGEAHYTLLASGQGGAIDDAFLYRLTAEDFLLVVNASNRRRDWDWLHDQSVPASVVVSDQTEALAMIALQGPRSEPLLARMGNAIVLPEARRNRLSVGKYEGHALIAARTGYTGERLGFELIVDAQVALSLWQRLVDAGALPAGLGARDSLRLEAGLPLYGHELGHDREGREIPIFACRISRYGVRKPGNGDYVGRQALDAQRAEHEAIVAGRLEPRQAQWLPQLVQPLAAFDARRPLRAGHNLFLDEEPVGYVTSGTSVPVGIASSNGVYTMRPIGLALVRSDIRFRPGTRIRFEVRDGDRMLMEVDLVERNLPSPLPNA